LDQQRIGEWLVKRGLVRESDIQRALEAAKKGGGRLASQLVGLKLLTEGAAVEALGSMFGVPGIDLSRSALSLGHLSLIPREVASLEKILPLSVVDDRLLLAISEPLNRRVLEEVQLISGLSVLPHAALASKLETAIREAYAAQVRGQKFWVGDALPRSQATEVLALRVAPASAAGLPSDDVLIEVEDDEAVSIAVTIEDEDNENSVDGLEEELAAVSARPHGPLILIVDDEEEILTLVARVLEKKGYRIEKARKGNEALKKVADLLPDLVLLDANLPEVHGFDICKKLKASPRFARIPVVLMTAVYRGWRFAHDSRESFGANDYIEKPFKLDDLVRRVEHHLSKAIGEPSREKVQGEKLYQEGVRLLESGQAPEAVASLEASVEADAFNPRAHYQLGRALQAAGDSYRAISAYERSVDLRPDHFPTLRSLAALYQQKGFRRKALEAWERAIPAAPDEATRQKIKNSLLALL
jgi:DNA-binding response OmpR family regulator